MEGALAGIWAEVLGVEKVGINDNFFDLGGHSLLAVRVVNLIRRRIGRTVRIADIFQAPTVERMASALHDAEATTPCSSLVPLQTKGSKPAFFWVHGDASNAYLRRYLDPEQRFIWITTPEHGWTARPLPECRRHSHSLPQRDLHRPTSWPLSTWRKLFWRLSSF